MAGHARWIKGKTGAKLAGMCLLALVCAGLWKAAARTDISLGVDLVFMAVLGGIVSAHAPTKLWHKAAYGLSFVVFGVVGMWCVVKQSNETAKADSDLKGAIADLHDVQSKVPILNKQLEGLSSQNTEANKHLADKQTTIEHKQATIEQMGYSLDAGCPKILWLRAARVA